MRPLALIVVGAGGAARSLIVVACSAVVSALLLVAVTMAKVGIPGDWGWEDPRFRATNLFAPLADPGTRGGTIFGVLVLTLPVIALLNQAVRLGTASRQRRYAGLEVAGATRSDLRRWAALEVGVPAGAGAVLGIPGWWVLRELLGRDLAERRIGAIVPPDLDPGPWSVVVVLAVAAVGAFVGARSAAPPRRARVAPKIPYAGPVMLAVGALLVAWVATGPGSEDGVLTFTGLVAMLLGMIWLTPALAGLTARRVARSARTGTLLLAARRLSADPGSAGRAALAAGAGGLTLGSLGGLMADLARSSPASAEEHYNAMTLVAVLTGVGFVLIGTSFAVHVADSVLAERRAYAALSASGCSVRGLLSALRWEALMATVPVAVLGSLVASVGFAVLMGGRGLWPLWSAVAVVVTVAAAIVSTVLAAALVAPIVRGAVATGSLRTE